MEKKPYTVKLPCPISEREEYVFFYPVEHQGAQYLAFNGCDHNFCKCEACEQCRKTAYARLIGDN